jgi:hypothetical protein
MPGVGGEWYVLVCQAIRTHTLFVRTQEQAHTSRRRGIALYFTFVGCVSIKGVNPLYLQREE